MKGLASELLVQSLSTLGHSYSLLISSSSSFMTESDAVESQ